MEPLIKCYADSRHSYFIIITIIIYQRKQDLTFHMNCLQRECQVLFSLKIAKYVYQSVICRSSVISTLKAAFKEGSILHCIFLFVCFVHIFLLL